MGRQARPVDRGDGPVAQADLDLPVVVEDDGPVGGQPDVALQAGGAQAQGQRERLDGVVGGVGAPAPVGEGDGRGPEGVDDAPTLRGLGTMERMEALWLLLIPVALVGGFFLVRGFVRLTKSIVELKSAMTELADAGAALNSVQEEVAKLGATVDEVHRQ